MSGCILEQDRAVASGNVVFRQGTSQIRRTAPTSTRNRARHVLQRQRLATVQPPRQTARPGRRRAAAAHRAGHDRVFLRRNGREDRAEEIQDHQGRFYDLRPADATMGLHAGTIVLNLDHYTLLKQVVMNVKGVPLLYLPVMYYPTQKDDRATGFLLPTYGASTLRGHSIHNAFFWAINRSQDATFLHDWFSKAAHRESDRISVQLRRRL